MPKIKSYEFGKIVVDDQFYNQDLVLSNTKVYSGWWRREGHRVVLDDLIEILEKEEPEVLIVGKGYYGYMEIDETLKAYLREKNIELVSGKTGDVWKEFNKLTEEGRKVVAAFHLTC
ncbi:MAG TPA: hypothetical protein ENF80_03650 [Thermofilum sp.]|nr:hypothetical protein [Thermofilum sp.]